LLMKRPDISGGAKKKKKKWNDKPSGKKSLCIRMATGAQSELERKTQDLGEGGVTAGRKDVQDRVGALKQTVENPGKNPIGTMNRGWRRQPEKGSCQRKSKNKSSLTFFLQGEEKVHLEKTTAFAPEQKKACEPPQHATRGGPIKGPCQRTFLRGQRREKET